MHQTHEAEFARLFAFKADSNQFCSLTRQYQSITFISFHFLKLIVGVFPGVSVRSPKFFRAVAPWLCACERDHPSERSTGCGIRAQITDCRGWLGWAVLRFVVCFFSEFPRKFAADFLSFHFRERLVWRSLGAWNWYALFHGLLDAPCGSHGGPSLQLTWALFWPKVPYKALETRSGIHSPFYGSVWCSSSVTDWVSKTF